MRNLSPRETVNRTFLIGSFGTQRGFPPLQSEGKRIEIPRSSGWNISKHMCDPIVRCGAPWELSKLRCTWLVSDSPFLILDIKSQYSISLKCTESILWRVSLWKNALYNLRISFHVYALESTKSKRLYLPQLFESQAELILQGCNCLRVWGCIHAVQKLKYGTTRNRKIHHSSLPVFGKGIYRALTESNYKSSDVSSQQKLATIV